MHERKGRGSGAESRPEPPPVPTRTTGTADSVGPRGRFLDSPPPRVNRGRSTPLNRARQTEGGKRDCRENIYRGGVNRPEERPTE